MSKDERKKQLGKGIRALLANMEDQPEERQSVVKQISKHVERVPIDWIELNPHQPRKDFDEDNLKSLAQSIKVHGIIQPLTLRRLSDEAYQLISGERRLRASKMAGLDSVPAYIRLADDQGMLEMALVENIQREDLNALEVAFSMNRLIRECNLTHEELSDRLGKDRSTVTNYLRLLKLPPEIQQAVRSQAISMGHARALAGIDNLPRQLMFFRQVIDQGLSVRKLEHLIRSSDSESLRSTRRGTTNFLTPELRQIQDELSGKFGSKVTFKRNADGKGTLTIHFTSDHNLNEILDVLQADED
ncbi:MAG: ParB/RepB/Spo0J family partition protein [Saprospiraceae bacterium]|nr:ParB/RepB/Spo0J family partition protein [Saprospiraceae bacterium]